MTLPLFQLNYKPFLDRSTIIYGESGTGKSFVIKDILHQLHPYVGQALIIAPTDKQNNTYSGGLIPMPFIHYEITSELLDTMWERQNALAAVYKRANNKQNIESLVNKLPQKDRIESVISAAQSKLQSYIKEVKQQYTDEEANTKITDMTADFDRLKELVIKHSIDEAKGYLMGLNLTTEEKYTLEYHNLNPRLVLIFDDCTDLLKKFKSHPVIQKLFYQGRWANITIIIACHTDKVLETEYKKNAFVTIFTEDGCARAYFDRPSTSLDKESKNRALAAVRSTFTPLAKHQKLVWIREERKFYRFTASAHPVFKFGSPHIWQYCEKIKADEGKTMTNNRYASYFT
jgi:hypothetical protein